MGQKNNPYHMRDTTQLTGWLFADLLLGLMMIFLVSVPKLFAPPPPLPPKFMMNSNILSPGVNGCTATNYQCTVTIGETSDSDPTNPLHWTAKSDMSDTNLSNTNTQVHFSPNQDNLMPGKTERVTITNIPCQNGSFTFSGSDPRVVPATILWQCSAKKLELNNPMNFNITVSNPAMFTSLTYTSEDQNIKNQVMKKTFLAGKRIGLVIAYGGANDGTGGDSLAGQGSDDAIHVYRILQNLANDRSAIGQAFIGAQYYYVPNANPQQALFSLNLQPGTILIEVYLFT